MGIAKCTCCEMDGVYDPESQYLGCISYDSCCWTCTVLINTVNTRDSSMQNIV